MAKPKITVLHYNTPVQCFGTQGKLQLCYCAKAAVLTFFFVR